MMPVAPKSNPKAAPALTTRANLGQILRWVKDGNGRFLIKRRGQPEAIVMSIEEYVNLVAPAPEWLKEARKSAEKAGLDKMTMEEIDAEIAEVRREHQEREEASVSV
jgi:prevent-host-death family protein